MKEHRYMNGMRYKTFVLCHVLAFTCMSQTLAPRFQPTVKPKPASLLSGTVRHAAFSGTRAIALIDPLDQSGKFSAWDLDSSAIAPLNQSLPKIPALSTLSTDYFVWLQPGPLQSKFHLHKLADESSQSFSVEITQIVQIRVIGEVLYVIHGRGSLYQLSRVDLKTKAVHRLDEFTSETPVLVFGHCDDVSLTILDPALARFRTYRLDQSNPSPYWTSISSQLIRDLKNQPAPFQAAASVKAFRMTVIGHFKGPEDKPWFLLSAAEKGVGLYAIQTDREGRELSRILLKHPEGNSRRMNPVHFSGFSFVNDSVRVISLNGDQLIYSGVFQ